MRSLTLLTAITFVAGRLLSAQAPPWAADKIFTLEDVEMDAAYPPGDLPADQHSMEAPAKQVTIFGNGHFEVRTFGLKTDVSRSNTPLPLSYVYELLDSFLSVQFFDLPDEFKGGARTVPFVTPSSTTTSHHFRITPALNATDLTYVDLTLRIENHSKRIRCWYNGAPPNLIQISSQIRKVVGLPAN